MNLPPIVHRGSVKNIRRELDEKELFFEYTDGYSIFDWGTMPDMLDGKGQSLATMADMFFNLLGSSNVWKDFKFSKFISEPILKKLQTSGLNHHGCSLVEGHPSFYKVKAVEILRPKPVQHEGCLKWDYSFYETHPINTLVPLEVIFRFGIPSGSSFLERAQDKNYCQTLGLEREVSEGNILNQPIVEYSSKLENSDRYMGYKEAAKIACLTEEEFNKLHGLSIALAYKLKDIFEELGIFLWDGKFEFAFIESGSGEEGREFMLVDSIGPDELRLSYDGVQLSKQNLRNFYKGGDWHQAVVKSKQIASQRGEVDWKKICIYELGKKPPSLEREILNGVEMMYKSLTNELMQKFCSKQVFMDTWNLEKTAKEMGKFL